MQDITKVKLVLIAFCLVPIAYSVGHDQGIKAGVTQADQEAFNAYVDFAKPFQAEVKAEKHRQTKTAKAMDAFTAAGL